MEKLSLEKISLVKIELKKVSVELIGSGGALPPTDFMLLESGDGFLLESGDKLGKE